MQKSKSSAHKGTVTKREAMREKRLQQQRRQRLYIILGIAAVAIVVAAILIVPSLLPAGEIVTVEAKSWPSEAGRSLGDENAPVKIEVYEDFQCPSCKNYSDSVEPQIVENLVAAGKVYYTFRHFPFLDDGQVRKESDQAANASMCAAEQNRFWDYKAMLFANWNGENQGAFADKRLVAFAEALGLDMDAFNKCFQADSYHDEIASDLAAGRMKEVKGTPSVFVNGEHLTPGYVPSYEQISQAVEAALATQGN